MKKTNKTILRKPIRHRVKHHIKMYVVPHEDNNYHPHMIRWYGLTTILLLVIANLLFFNQSSNYSVLGTTEPVSPQQLLSNTNEQRTNNSLPGLEYNPELAQAAFLKAQDMFSRQYWAHNAPDGTPPWYWFSKVGYNYEYAGENLAKNYHSADSAVAAWMASPEHRENVLSSHYSDVGFAVVDGFLNSKKTTLIVALYGEVQKEVEQVAGATVVKETSAPLMGGLSPISRFGLTLQTLSPTALGSVMLLLIAAAVALVTYLNRHYLPQSMKKTWRYHHGLYKSLALMTFVVVFVLLYSGGQI